MAERRDHGGIFAFAKKDEAAEDEGTITIPEDLDDRDAHPDDELTSLEESLVEAFGELKESGLLDTATIESMSELADGLDSVRAEMARRQQADEDAAATIAELSNRVTAQSEGEGDEGDEGAEGAEGDEGADDESELVETPEPTAEDGEVGGEPAPQAVAASTRPAQRVPATVSKERRINVPLAEVRKRRRAQLAGQAPRQNTIRASADVPGFLAGSELESLQDLAKAISERSRTTPITQSGNVTGPKVASMMREFEHRVSLDSGSDHVDAVMKAATNQESLVAAGGWCAPSEIMYDFFNIADEDGILDLPTVGISRGGVRFPTSPSLADVFGNVFLWTETDDIATITGGPNKPCFRPPCPTFNEERLECHGVCVTAGNLTEEAYPELIANHLALTMSAHVHVMNLRHIADIVAQSTAVDVTEGANPAITASVLGAVELQVWDYRARYGMADSAILEVVLPSWVKGQMRSDLAKRNGVDLLAVTDAQLNTWLNLRGVRAQFVQDWQVRAGDFPGQATPRQDWPAAVSFLLYAAGTFVLGQGMTLDLGVTRDSVLNAENDHTAAWTEDCRLIARIGHESRVVTVTADNAGNTGAVNITGTGV
jgi:hypothetical protein